MLQQELAAAGKKEYFYGVWNRMFKYEDLRLKVALCISYMFLSGANSRSLRF